MSSANRLADGLLLLAFRSLAFLSLFGILWMQISGPILASAGFLIVVVAITLTIALHSHRLRSADLTERVFSGEGLGAPRVNTAWAMLAPIIALGFALRLLVWLVYPVNFEADHRIYLELANQLAYEGRYQAAQGRAFWPPGFPLVLAPFVALFGTYGLISFNLAAYLALALSSWGLAKQLFDQRVALIAVAILSFWPNLIFMTPLALKEAVVAAGMPALALCYLRAHESGRNSLTYAAAAGFVAGIVSLAQPSSLLVIGVIAAAEAWRTCETRCWRSGALRIVIFSIGMAMTVAPWTIRNYAVLGVFVPIGTAGGVNFSTVNAPTSDGRWNAPGHRAAFGLSDDEIERNRKGFEMGWRFIAEHPQRFASIAVRKPLYMFGDDTKNIYWATNRDTSVGARHVATLKLSSIAHYFLIVIAITYWAWSRPLITQHTIGQRLAMLLCLFPIPAQAVWTNRSQNLMEAK
jgi:4-amino-4-deoxy-L-arabinose transferase-like glycosyltransferase